MYLDALPYKAIWCVDFEFNAPLGDRPRPICLVAQELRSGRKIRLWKNQLERLRRPPYGTGIDCLFVAYYASAEVGCHLTLDWPVSRRVLDLFAEFRVRTNGKELPSGAGLLGACAYFGIDAIDVTEKDSLRELAMRGGPWTEKERRELLDYCESDVRALARLLEKMLPEVDLPRALLRGRYMVAAARIENAGVPIDVPTFRKLTTHWSTLRDRLIARVDRAYGVYDGRTFKTDRFEQFLIRKGIAWPRLASGQLALDDDTFREMARSHRQLVDLREPTR